MERLERQLILRVVVIRDLDLVIRDLDLVVIRDNEHENSFKVFSHIVKK